MAASSKCTIDTGPALPRNLTETKLWLLDSPYHVPDWRVAEFLGLTTAEMSTFRKDLSARPGALGQELNAHADTLGKRALPPSKRFYWRLADSSELYEGQEVYPALKQFTPGEQREFGRHVCSKHAAMLSKALARQPIRHTIEWRAFVEDVYPPLTQIFGDDADSYDVNSDSRDERARSEVVCAILRSMAFWGCFDEASTKVDLIKSQFERYITSLHEAASLMLDAISPANWSQTCARKQKTKSSVNERGKQPAASSQQPAANQSREDAPTKTVQTYNCKICVEGKSRVRSEVIKFVCTAIVNRTPQTVMNALFSAAQRRYRPRSSRSSCRICQRAARSR